MNDYSSSTKPSWYKYKDLIKEIAIEEGITTIGSYAFYDLPIVESIVIPASVDIIGSYGVYSCASLKYAYHYSTVRPTTVNTGFLSNCGTTMLHVLKSDSYGTISGIDVQQPTEPTGSIWYYRSGELLVIYGNGPTSTSYYSSKYSGKINAPWGDHRGTIKTIRIEHGVTSIGSYCFYYDGDAYYFTSLHISGTVTSIGDRAFYQLASLESIVLPEGLQTIGTYAFYGCAVLNSFMFASSVTSIGSNALAYCSLLTHVYHHSDTKPTTVGTYFLTSCGTTELHVLSSTNYGTISGVTIVQDDGTSATYYESVTD